ncbi:hypothetical protein BBJ28_00014870 [Nothophytophthora sp. Chile5]|nr:hypothetical protein BBJ28_00014870 [Nothophytophthora sp. Chile5]
MVPSAQGPTRRFAAAASPLQGDPMADGDSWPFPASAVDVATPLSTPCDKNPPFQGAPNTTSMAVNTPPPYADLYASSTSPSSGEDQPPEPTGLAMPRGTATTTPEVGRATTTPSGINSMWLNWENPRAVMELCADSESGSALEMRRQKNRDSMRRSRQRQRDQLQLLRDAVAELEQQYTELCLRSEPMAANSRSGAGAKQTENERNSKYTDAVELAKQLGAENLYLKASIQYQASWKLELRRVMETTVVLDEFTASASSPPSPFPFKLEILNAQEAASVYGFHELSERDVKDLILDNTRSVKRIQNMLLGALSRGGSGNNSDSDEVDEDMSEEVLGPVTRSELFGWDLRRRVRGNEMEFVFTKRFEKLSVSELMHKAWVNEMRLDGAKMVKYDVQRLEILQEANSNAYVLGRDVRSPDEDPVFRTTLLRYRMETTGEMPANGSSLLSAGELDDGEPMLDSTLSASGFVIGTQSLNPSNNSGAKLLPERNGFKPSARLVWADLSHAIEMLQVVDRVTGEEQYVQVRWAGKTNYGTPFDAHRNAADMVTTLMRWESGTIAPALQLVPNSEDDDCHSRHEEADVTTPSDSAA